MFSVLVIRLRSLRLLRVSGIVMRLRMFLLLITFLKASHSFRNRLLVICKNAYLFATMIMTSVSSPSHFFDLVIGKILTSRLSLSKHLAHNLGNLLLLGKIGVFHNRRNASSRLLLLISKHLILCIYLVFRILA